MISVSVPASCTLCPRKCGVNRTQAAGFCGAGPALRVARAALHPWEEPCISGTRGSGTVFFSGCSLQCCYCQNYPISAEGFGKDITPQRLSDIFLHLQQQGAQHQSGHPHAVAAVDPACAAGCPQPGAADSHRVQHRRL